MNRRSFFKTLMIGTVAIALPIPALEPLIKPSLKDIAIAAGKLNGDTQFAYASLVLGIKRGSAMILDNLGISINLTDKWERYADAWTTGIFHMSEKTKQQITLNAVLEEGSKLL